MRSGKFGTDTSGPEVIGITPHGIWLLHDDTEHFLPFDQFPWFKEAQVRAVLHVECPHPHHLHWPLMDVDLHVDSIMHPENYPLVSKERP